MNNDKYKDIKRIMNLTDENIENTLQVLQTLDGLYAHAVYNTIMTSDLNQKERLLAFFLWGVQFGIGLTTNLEDYYDEYF